MHTTAVNGKVSSPALACQSIITALSHGPPPADMPVLRRSIFNQYNNNSLKYAHVVAYLHCLSHPSPAFPRRPIQLCDRRFTFPGRCFYTTVSSRRIFTVALDFPAPCSGGKASFCSSAVSFRCILLQGASRRVDSSQYLCIVIFHIVWCRDGDGAAEEEDTLSQACVPRQLPVCGHVVCTACAIVSFIECGEEARFDPTDVTAAPVIHTRGSLSTNQFARYFRMRSGRHADIFGCSLIFHTHLRRDPLVSSVQCPILTCQVHSPLPDGTVAGLPVMHTVGQLAAVSRIQWCANRFSVHHFRA